MFWDSKSIVDVIPTHGIENDRFNAMTRCWTFSKQWCAQLNCIHS